MGPDELPDPVVWLMGLVCFFLWLATRFFDFLLVMPVVSSFDTLVAGFELLPEYMLPCAKAAGEAAIKAVITIAGIVSFM